jgi:hypothetical protein
MQHARKSFASGNGRPIHAASYQYTSRVRRSTVVVNYLEASIAADLPASDSIAEAYKAIFAWLKMLCMRSYVLRDVGGCMYGLRRSPSHHPVSRVRSQV